MSLRDTVGSRLEGLTPVRRELRALREAHERLREELVAQQQRAEEVTEEHREEVRRLEAARDKLGAERDQLTEKLESVLQSQSFRVGHALALCARFPLVAVRAVASFVARVARGLLRRVIRPTGRAIVRAARALWAALRSLPPRVARLLAARRPRRQGHAAEEGAARRLRAGSPPSPSRPPRRIRG